MGWKSKAHRDAYRRKNKKRLQRQQRAWFTRNRVKHARWRKAYKTTNKERIRRKQRAYYRKNKATILKKRKAYYQRNKKRIRARDAAWAAKNRTHVLAYGAAWRRRKRRAKLERLRKQKFRCANKACGKKLTVRTAHADHCHKTGKDRELLCHGCNTALGSLRDDPKVCRGLADYAIKHK